MDAEVNPGLSATMSLQCRGCRPDDDSVEPDSMEDSGSKVRHTIPLLNA